MTTKKIPATPGPNKQDEKAMQDWEQHHDLSNRFPEEAKGIAETEVKNAHSSGDGSMGPNDTPLPDSENSDEQRRAEPLY